MSSTDLKTRQESKTAKPKKYAVVFYNDDFTPMEFVVQVMMAVFGHDAAQAEAITMDIHKKGKGVAGVYTHEIAEVKSTKAQDAARRYEFPLKCEVVPEEG